MVYENTLYREYKTCSIHHNYNYLETHSVIAATARYPAGFAVSASSNTNNIKTISRLSYLKTIFNFLFCLYSEQATSHIRLGLQREKMTSCDSFHLLCVASCFVSAVGFALE